MSKFIMLVGLPASGKSTLAEKLAVNYNAYILSSDAIREELYNDINDQSNNSKVFEVMNKRTKDLLLKGENVIYDATNINRKRRIHLINNELKVDEKIVYYMNTSFINCLHNDSQRNRRVGYEVVDKMYRTLQIPTKLEGWDKVIFINDDCRLKKQYRELLEVYLPSDLEYDYLFTELSKIIDEIEDVYEVPHDSTYHSFSISRHIYYVYQYVRDKYKGKRKREMLYAALFHDLGKGYCKSFYNYKGEEKRYASYIGHEWVSAQLASEHLVKLGYEDEIVKYVVDLVQFHMTPMNMSAKQEKKLRTLLTEEQYEDLMFLHEADLNAK